MRTNIDIDDDLLQAVMKSGGFRTKKSAVEASLRMLAKIQGQKEIRKLVGKVKWHGDLNESRLNRFPGEWDLKSNQ